MKLLNNYITEKLKINSKSKISIKDKENWSIKTAEDGDIIYNGSFLFIYKCLRKDCKIPHNNASPNAIVYHAICYHSGRIKVEIDTGVGTDDNDYYELATDEQCENFYKALEKNGYKWDDNKKEIVKL